MKDYFCRLFSELPEPELDAAWRVELLRRGKNLLADALRLEESGEVTNAYKVLNRLFGIE